MRGEIVALDTPENLRLQYAKDQIQVVLKDKQKEVVQKDELGAKRISEWMKKVNYYPFIHTNQR